MGKITIEFERCKGCLLCIRACPQNASVGTAIYAKGLSPAEQTNLRLHGCLLAPWYALYRHHRLPING